jgi:biopolymer transport protein TolQ
MGAQQLSYRFVNLLLTIKEAESPACRKAPEFGDISLKFDKFRRHRLRLRKPASPHRKERFMDLQAVGPAAAHADLSVWALFMQADLVVKAVMIGLLAASVWCWAIIIDKSMLYGRVRREMNRFERVFWSGQSLEQLYQQLSEKNTVGLGAVFVAAMKEWKRSHEQNAASPIGMQSRLDKVLDVAIGRESEALEKRLGFLATVGSASPFVGLFGTVWGIMNAFTAIAASSSTNLAVVAGPIAEALFATALGLLAAIPAVIAYNKLSGDANKMIARLEGFADEFSTILSRQLEARGGR